jgi:molybdate transport system substrate-binding protein
MLMPSSYARSLVGATASWYERSVLSRRGRWLRLVALTLLATSSARADTVTVFAAASLTEAFRTIAKDFEAARAGTKVELNFAGSSTLARQIVEGAPADVFASADDESMQKVVAAGDVADGPQPFVRNRLAIIVPKGNPKHLASLTDLGRSGLTLALAVPAVPVGRYALDAFEKAGVTAPAATNEVDVKAVVTRVAMGEADAGVVYATDVGAGGAKIEGVTIPDAHNVLARYPIATLKGASNGAGARDFVSYVLSPPAQRVLAGVGFLAP